MSFTRKPGDAAMQSEPPASAPGGAPARESDSDSHISTNRPALPDVAALLVSAYRQRITVEAPSRALPGLSQAQALEVAEGVRSLRIAAGDAPVGYKIGFTNDAVRRQFNAHGRLAATVYASTLQQVPRVDARVLLGPRIEPEVVVGIADDGAITWAALGFEIVQSHVANWDFTFLDAIADFGLHAALVVGERVPWTSGRAEFGDVAVRLLRNGELVEVGASSDVDGGPAGSVAWLRDDLARVGRTLLPGELVSTGSMTRVPAIASGETWTIETLDATLPALTIAVD